MSDETKNTIEVDFYGKKVKGEPVADGVVRRATRKSAKSFLVRCSVTGKWCYCSTERMDSLTKRHGSVDGVGLYYTSREGKAQVKREAADAATTHEASTEDID